MRLPTVLHSCGLDTSQLISCWQCWLLLAVSWPCLLSKRPCHCKDQPHEPLRTVTEHRRYAVMTGSLVYCQPHLGRHSTSGGRVGGGHRNIKCINLSKTHRPLTTSLHHLRQALPEVNTGPFLRAMLQYKVPLLPPSQPSDDMSMVHVQD